MNRDVIERAAQVLSTLTTCDGQPYTTELHYRQAHALADAGLLARPVPTLAEAWDEGQAAGWAEDCAYDATNPHRKEQTDD